MRKQNPSENDFIIEFTFQKLKKQSRRQIQKLQTPVSFSIRFLLLLAHQLNDMLEKGQFRNLADIAGQTGISRARVTQILDLVLLAPSIQEEILQGPNQHLHIRERHIRALVKKLDWEEQLQGWQALLKSFSSKNLSTTAS